MSVELRPSVPPAAPHPVEPLDEHNRALLEQVHPADWRNPEPAGRYNMVVIGAGTAGLVTASGSAGLGAKVALVERHLMGGDCLNVGCVPSKALIRAARAIADVRDAGALGIRVPGGFEVDFPAIMERMRRLRAGIAPVDGAPRYRDLGIDTYIGEARFLGPDAVEVDGRVLRFARACIATGARAVVPPIPGLREAGFLTNETVFNLTVLPRRIVSIGAGPIGCELAQAFARFGATVHLVERSEHVLSREDADAAAAVGRALTRDAVIVHARSKVVRVETRGTGKVVVLEKDGRTEEITCDAILVATGRAPNVEGLGLEEAGVKYDAREGVRVDDRLRTTNPRIYAAGDVASRWKFTHAADFLARTVIANALFFGRGKASGLLIPRCTYTDPEVAAVGADERDLKKDGIPYRTFVQEMAHVDRAILDGETDGFVKILVGEKSDRILGATIVARHAGDMIGEVTLAMANGIGLGAVSKAIHPYPTQAEAIRKAGDLYNRTRLTPRAKRLTSAVMRWRR